MIQWSKRLGAEMKKKLGRRRRRQRSVGRSRHGDCGLRLEPLENRYLLSHPSTWSGAFDNDYNNGANWTNGGPSTFPSMFFQGSMNTNINVTQFSSPGSNRMTFNSPNFTISGLNVFLSGSGQIVVNTPSATINAPLAAFTTVSKLGTGTLTLGGTSTYTSATTTSAGRIDVTGALSGGGAVNVSSTGTLGGTGSITGAVTVNSGGTLAPGVSPGVLNTGSVNLAANSSFDVEVGGPSPGNTATDHDQLAVTGTVTIGSNVTLNTASFGGFTPSVGDQYVIINNDGADAVTGTFAGLPEGATLSNFLGSGRNAYVTYKGGDGNDVALSASIVVTTAVDENNGSPDPNLGSGTSLREAISFSNSNAGTDTVAFDIPGAGPHTISLGSALPNITESVIIDGFSQPGASPNTNPVTQADNAVRTVKVAGNGNEFVLVDAGGTTIRGLHFEGSNQNGIRIFSGSGSTLAGNLLTNVAGFAVQVYTDGHTIGRSNAEDRNVISGNGVGVHLFCGTAAQQPFGCAAGKVAENIVVAGNFIGLAADGVTALGNTANGIRVDGGKNNTIGGTNLAARNMIANNGSGYSSSHGVNNTIQGNFFGLDINGAAAGNGSGITLGTSATDNVIGGLTSGEGNVIAHSTNNAVQITAATGNIVSGNSIHSNGGLGIDLEANGVTPNDPGDGDTGANNLQNFPLITAANGSTISGTIDSAPSTQFTLEFFANTAVNPAGNGEGQTLLGATSVTTNSSGLGSFNFAYTAVGGQPVIAATATDPSGNTSEFSAAVTEQLPTTAVTLAGNDLRVEDSAGGNTDDSLTVSTDGTSVTVFDPNNLLTTSVPGATGGGTNTVVAPLSAFTGSILIDTLGGDDVLTIDLSSGNFSRAISYDGGTNGVGGDALALTGGGSFATALYSYTDADTGNIDVAGNSTFSYDNTEPISSTINATNVTLNYGSTLETITVTNPGGSQTTVNSTAGEITTFNNPTGTLSLNAGSGGDTINVSSLAASYPANISIDGQADNDQINLNGSVSLAAGKTLSVTGDTITVAASLAVAGAGTVTLDALDDVNVNSTISAGSGAIQIKADDDVIFTVTGDITTSGGGILVTADDDATPDAGSGGRITMADDNSIDSTVINAGSGTITMSADEDIFIGRIITTNSTASAANVTSVSGAINDVGDIGGADVSAPNGTATFTANGAASGAVGVDPFFQFLDVSAAKVVAATGGFLGLNFDITGNALAVFNATGGGHITVQGTGELTTDGTWAADGVNVNRTGNISLNHDITTDTTTGMFFGSSAGTITVGPGATLDSDDVVDANDGKITLQANDVELDTSATPASILAGTKEVGFLTNNGVNVDLGATGGSSAYVLTDAELDRAFTSKHVRVGNAFSGSVTFTATVSMANADTLDVVAGGGPITEGASLVGNAYEDVNLALQTGAFAFGDDIGTSADPITVDVDVLAAVGALGDVYIHDVDSVILGQAASTPGVFSPNDSARVSADGTITVSTNVGVGGSGGLELDARGANSDLIINANVSQATTSGNIVLKADRNITGNTNGTIDVNDGGTIFITADDDASGTGTIDLDGTITLNRNAAAAEPSLVVSLPTGQTGSLDGVIADDSAASLVKNGGGTLVLTANNTYRGATTVNDGILLINGSTAAQSTITVPSGSTLGGTGTINGPVSVGGGAVVAPGTSPGILSTGNVDFQANSSFDVEIGGTSAGNTSSDHDQPDR